jgi:two-component system chemotaxis response regulator CheB
MLNRRRRMPARHAEDGEPIEPGRIVVAPPDHHLMVHDGKLLLTRGPKEHHARPAIDPLFRSAALAHGAGVISVLLSGGLDDGVVGLQVIKQCGGIVVVQDPADAEEPSMPSQALARVDVDHCLPLDEIPALLRRLVGEEVPTTATPVRPEVAMQENQISQEPTTHNVDRLRKIGAPSTFVCPDCSGALWEIRDSQPPRYRCHTGHAYSLLSLQAELAKRTEEALWSAIRALQEQALALERVPAADADDAPSDPRIDELRENADLLRRLVEA